MPNWTESSHLQRREKKKKNRYGKEKMILSSTARTYGAAALELKKTTQTGENDHTMQIDGATDSEEGGRRRGGGGVIACRCCVESNLRAIKRRGRPTALQFAFWKQQAGREKSLGTAPDPIGHFYWTTTVTGIRPTLVRTDWQKHQTNNLTKR